MRGGGLAYWDEMVVASPQRGEMLIAWESSSSLRCSVGAQSLLPASAKVPLLGFRS
jgi:hypothetical protein